MSAINAAIVIVIKIVKSPHQIAHVALISSIEITFPYG